MMKRIRTNPFYLLNKKAMTIIEVLVAAGLASIVSLGIATMMQNAMVEQKKAVLFSTLRELKLRMENVIRDQAAWDRTVNCTSSTTPACATYNNSTFWNNVRANTAASEIAYTAPEKIILFDAASNTAFNLLAWDNTGSNGFTESGGPCTTFSSGTGVDACPISYRLVVAADCSSGTSCRNPQLKITARLIFNPSTTGTLNKFRGLVAVGSLTTTADGAGNDGKYDVVVKRTPSQINKAFKLIAYKLSGGASVNYSGFWSNCDLNGAGTCSTSAAIHPLTTAAGWTLDSGSDSTLVTYNSPSNGYFKFNEVGTFSCSISAPGFGTGGLTIKLRNTTSSVDVATATTIAGMWNMSNAYIDARFNVNSLTDTYAIYQQCGAVPVSNAWSDPDISKCSLGMATDPYVASPGSPIVIVACTKIDKAF